MSQLTTCSTCQRSYPTGTRICPDDGTSLSGALAAPLVGAGFKIGEYLLEKKIGEGGMGEVWSARHPQIGKQVAIKLLSENMVLNQRAVTRFSQEARAVNEIQHRNIVDIFAFGELPDGRPYFVMEFLKGKSLADYLEEKGPLPFSEILSIFEQVCSALQASHERNIVHRDLKPDNIFLIFEGATRSRSASLLVKILDFGIAKLDAPEGEGLTKTGATMGTPAYMSPEQCEGAKTAEQTSDIYSMGIILFELLTGRTPFREPNDGVGLIISKHMFMPVVPPSQRVSGRSIPAEVDALVLRALAKKTKDRFASCTDFFEALIGASAALANETSEQVKGARPIFETRAPDSDSLEKVMADGLQKKTVTQAAPIQDVSISQTGDYYSSNQEGQLEKFRPGRSRGLMVFASLGVVVLAVGLFMVFGPSGVPTTGIEITAESPRPTSASQPATTSTTPDTKTKEPTTPESIPATGPTTELVVPVPPKKPPRKDPKNPPKNSSNSEESDIIIDYTEKN